MYELKESRKMKPKTFANMVSNMLYERRWLLLLGPHQLLFSFCSVINIGVFIFTLSLLLFAPLSSFPVPPFLPILLLRFGPFFVEPIVAGLDPVTFEPYICNMVGHRKMT